MHFDAQKLLRGRLDVKSILTGDLPPSFFFFLLHLMDDWERHSLVLVTVLSHSPARNA
jgi:hypothetical protein